MDQINVNTEEIMREIRAGIREKALAEVDIDKVMAEIRDQVARLDRDPIPEFADVRMDAPSSHPGAARAAAPGYNDGLLKKLSGDIQYMKETHAIDYSWDLGGGPKGFVKKVLRRLLRCILWPLRQRQNDFNQYTTNSIDELRQAVANVTAQLEGRANALDAQVDMLNAGMEAVNARLGFCDERIDGQDKNIDEISSFVTHNFHRYQAAPQAAASAETGAGAPAAPVTPAIESGMYEGMDYTQFQNDFRGTQAQILERQKQYLSYFRDRKGPVMDLGCGRGEFLRLLKEEGIQAFGVDTYAEYAVTGEMHGVDIRVGDGIDMLARQEEPLGGIFCAQVIEHLGFQNVIRLCRLAHEKLEEGGCLVLETPNPMSLTAMTQAFYLDPTHDKPVHPMLMEYLLKSMGYSEVELVWPDHSLPQLPPIDSDAIRNLDEVNRAIERVSNLLYGSQDYAVVARK